MKDKSEYISYKLKKASQSLKEAKLLMENGMNDTAVSRLYMLHFMLLTHCLPLMDSIPKTHSGTKSVFNKEFIISKKIDGHFSDFYSFLMAKRFEADYDDFAFIDESRMLSLFEETTALIAVTREFMEVK